jgi:hypothetical protein
VGVSLSDSFRQLLGGGIAKRVAVTDRVPDGPGSRRQGWDDERHYVVNATYDAVIPLTHRRFKHSGRRSTDDGSQTARWNHENS